MEILKKFEGEVLVFELSGRLDAGGSQQAQEAIIPYIPKDGKMILDMSGCDYVASSGLRILLIAAKQSMAVNCKTVLCAIQPLVNDVIVMTGFENVLESFSSQAEALTNLE